MKDGTKMKYKLSYIIIFLPSFFTAVDGFGAAILCFPNPAPGLGLLAGLPWLSAVPTVKSRELWET